MKNEEGRNDMKIWKQNFTVMAIAAIIALTLSACFSEWEEETGNLIINLGGGSGRSAMPLWPPKDILLDYEITLSGNGNTITIPAQDGETISATVSVGHWNVYVEAYFEGDLYAKSSGDDSVDVKAKQNNPVSIQMHKAFSDSLDRITAVYNSATHVYTFTLLDSLKDHLTVTAFYKDKSDRELYADEYTLSGTLTAGTSTVTVSYTDGGVTRRTTFNVTVSSATLSGIEVEFDQNAPAIYTSTPLNSLKQYLTVKAAYSNGDKETLSTHEYTLSGTLTAGKPTITVNYGGQSAAFNPDVTAVVLVNITVQYDGPETIYTSAALDDLNTYLTVTAFYNDGNEDTLSAHEYTLTGTLTTGQQTIIVYYGGQSATFDLTVAPVIIKILVEYDNDSAPAIYTSTSLDSLKTYLTVTAIYDSENSRILGPDEYTLSPLSGEFTAGAPTIIVSCTEGPVTRTNSFFIPDVILVVPTAIDVQYNGIGIVGGNQTINDLKTDFTVTAAYNDGSSKTLDASEYYLINNISTNGQSDDTLIGSITTNGPKSVRVRYTYNGISRDSSDLFTVTVYTSFYTVSDETSWNTATGAIKAQTSGSHFINITNDFSRTAGDRSPGDADYSGGGYGGTFGSRNVTINGGNHTITLTGTGCLLLLGYDQTVTVSDLNLVGNKSNNISLVSFPYTATGSDSALTMNNCTVTGNMGGTGGGGGVYVIDGTFTMNGGEISGNELSGDGGGVYLHGGTFTMNGGEISDNISSGSGGGVCVVRLGYNPGTFIMNGGKISGNEASSGGGVNVADSNSTDPELISTFTMNGGTISGNTARFNGGGVRVQGDGILRIVTGTVYGSNENGNDENGNPLANTHASTGLSSGAAWVGTVQYGTFSGGTWVRAGTLSATSENTIRVTNGVLQP